MINTGDSEQYFYTYAMGKPPYLKPPSKEELRQNLNRDVDQFLAKGGRIHQFDPGETAIDSPHKAVHAPLFNDPPSQRTPLHEVIAALDERRQQMKSRHSSSRRKVPSKPRKKVIYDDFGEPLRTIWEDD